MAGLAKECTTVDLNVKGISVDSERKGNAVHDGASLETNGRYDADMSVPV